MLALIDSIAWSIARVPDPAFGLVAKNASTWIMGRRWGHDDGEEGWGHGNMEVMGRRGYGHRRRDEVMVLGGNEVIWNEQQIWHTYSHTSIHTSHNYPYTFTRTCMGTHTHNAQHIYNVGTSKSLKGITTQSGAIVHTSLSSSSVEKALVMVLMRLVKENSPSPYLKCGGVSNIIWFTH